ncbi:MAG: hypothetical protein HKM93_05010 [Desulfobacteraceae bacterium]|nr:hypothetical protein [Desulfobacteraceae bacterium]
MFSRILQETGRRRSGYMPDGGRLVFFFAHSKGRFPMAGRKYDATLIRHKEGKIGWTGFGGMKYRIEC